MNRKEKVWQFNQRAKRELEQLKNSLTYDQLTALRAINERYGQALKKISTMGSYPANAGWAIEIARAALDEKGEGK